MLNVVAVISTIILGFFWSNRRTAFNNGTAASSQVDITAAGYTISDNLSFLSSNAVVTNWEVNLAFGIFVTVAICTGLFLLITIVMVRKIRMAIEIINEASEAFRSLPGIQFLPLFFAAPLGLLLVYFIYIMLFLMTPTSDQITISGFGFTYAGKNASYYMIWYHMGGFIWAFYTIQGMLQLTIAGAVAEWYWTFDKKTSLQAPVINSFIRAVKYSFGSVILGSLLITIVELIRIALYNLQKQIASSPNPWLKYLVSCAQCCMKCIEMIVKWINKNAYVYIAITGKAFFAAAGCATSLLLRNAAKTIAVTYVGEAALILAKIAIVGFNCILSYAFMYYFPSALAQGVTNPTLTVVMVGVITYTVASLFLSNYQLAIDTIFLSALEDLDKNDGSASRPYFMSDSLKKIMQTKNFGKVDQL
jgi:solute carrier family 44 (choline transporter-like protein), member 1